VASQAPASTNDMETHEPAVAATTIVRIRSASRAGGYEDMYLCVQGNNNLSLETPNDSKNIKPTEWFVSDPKTTANDDDDDAAAAAADDDERNVHVGIKKGDIVRWQYPERMTWKTSLHRRGGMCSHVVRKQLDDGKLQTLEQFLAPKLTELEMLAADEQYMDLPVRRDLRDGQLEESDDLEVVKVDAKQNIIHTKLPNTPDGGRNTIYCFYKRYLRLKRESLDH